MRNIFSKLAIAVSGLTISLSALSVPNIKPGEILRENQVYRTSISSQPPSFDPNIQYDSISGDILLNVFTPLVREDVEGKIIPYAAESWDISPDGKTYTFYLRKDGKWTNGEPVTADDFVFAWQRLVDPKTASNAQAYLNPLYVVNSEEIVNGEKPATDLGVKAIDEYTFQVELTKQVPWFLSAVSSSSLAVVPKSVVLKHGQDWVKPENIVSNGPFFIAEAKVNEKVVLKKNPSYWNADKVILTEVNYRIVNNTLQNYRSFEAGDLDVSGVPKTAFAEAKKSGNLHSSRQYSTFGYAFNVNLVPDIRIRKAIALALDNKLIIERVVKKNQPYAQSWSLPFLHDGEKIKPMDVLSIPQNERNKQAQELLKEAGYSKAKPYEITLTTPTGDADQKQKTVAIQNVINSNTGGLVKVNLETVEWKAFIQGQQKGAYALSQAGWGADFNHVSNFLGLYLKGSGSNYAHIDDSVYADYFNRANSEVDPIKRAELYAQAENQLVNVSYAVIPFEWAVSNTLYNPAFRGYSVKALSQYQEDRYFIDLEKSKVK